MEIKTLKEVLELLVAVNINTVILEPEEGSDGGEFTKIRCMNSNQSIFVVDTISEKMVEAPMRIQNVKALYSRIILFDGEKSSISVEMDDNLTEVRNLIIKEGRKKVSFRCASGPKSITAPKVLMVEPDLDKEPIRMTKDFVNYIGSAMSAISQTGNKDMQAISLECKDDELTISVFDGSHDSFTHTIEVDNVIEFDKLNWDISSFSRVAKQVTSDGDDLVLYVDPDGGCGFVITEPFSLLLAPLAD